jgi:DNA-binding beta-propeller fold protein YncE
MRRLLAVALVLLALPAAGAARTSGGTPVAIVATAQGARLVALDVWTGRTRGDVRLPAPGRAVASTIDGRRVLVATGAGVLLVDMLRERVLARFGGLRDVVDVALTPDGRRGFALDRARGTLAVLDLVRLRVAGRVRVGRRPHALAVGDNRVWVAHEDETLVVVDAPPGAEPVVAGRLPAGGRVRALLHVPDSAWLLVTYRDSGDVAKLDAGIDARVVFRRAAGMRPAALGVNWLTTELWVADGTRLVRFSSRTGARRGAAVEAGSPIRQVEPFGGYMAAVTARDIRIFGPRGRRIAVTPVAYGVAGFAMAVFP